MAGLMSWLMIVSLVFLALPNQLLSQTTRFNFTFFDGTESDLIYQGDAHIANLLPALAPPVPVGETFIRLTSTEPNRPLVPLQNRTGRVLYAPPIRLWDAEGGQQASFSTQFKGFIGDLRGDPVFGDGIAFFITSVNSTIPPGSHGGNLGIYDSSGASPVPLFAVELDVFSNIWDPGFAHVGININSRTSMKVARWAAQVPVVMRDVDVRIFYSPSSRLVDVRAFFKATNPAQQNILPILARVEYALDLKTVLPEWVQIGISASTGQFHTALHDIRQWSFSSRMLSDGINDNYIIRQVQS